MEIKKKLKGGANMIVRYHQLPQEVRDLTRAIESKGHAAYIRALMLKRIPFNKINPELSRLALAGVEDRFYKEYFIHNIVPLLEKRKLFKYYSKYASGKKVAPLDFEKDFGNDEDARIEFCKIIEQTDTHSFFSEELFKYYGDNIPLGDTGEPVVTISKQGKVLDILLHEKRHYIDGWLAEGYSPKMISQTLEERYDIQVEAKDISQYAKSFMNTKRKSMEDAIDELQQEREALESQMLSIKQDDSYSIGEKMMMIATLKEKVSVLDDRIRNAKVVHNAGAFATGVLEYNDLRYMFSDMAQRAYRRFLNIDEKTEYNVIPRLVQLTSIVAKSSEKIIMLDKAMSETHSKTINEEMLEVIAPTLDRLEEEEVAARKGFMELYAPQDFLDQASDEAELIDIIGVDE